MATIIQIPTWATFNKIPPGTPADKLATLGALLGITLNVGDANPIWPDLQDLDLGGGHLKYRGSTMEELAEFIGIENTSFLTIPYIQMAVAIGGEVELYPVMLELPADLDTEIPASFPNRIIHSLDENEQPVETIHTFASYFPPEVRREIDGTVYSPAQAWAGQVQGAHLKASEWVASGLPVITVAEFQALLPAPEIV